MVKKIKILNRILKVTGMWPLVNGFVSFLLVCALIICLFDPGVDNYGDALWYLFASFTTIGYGDIVATSLVGRIITVVVSLYGILVVAFIPAVVIGYFTEYNKIRAKESTLTFLEKLENLPTLSKEELEMISNAVRNRKYKL